MKHLKFKHFLWALLAIVVFGIVVTIKGFWPQPSPHVAEGDVPMLTPVSQTDFPVNEVESGLPESIRPCLPDNFAQASLMATLEYQGSTLYHVSVTVADDSAQPLIAVKDGSCKVLNPREDDSDVTLSSVIEPEIAKQLAVQRYQRSFEQVGGKEKFQDLFLQDTKGTEPVWISQENYDALVELGIEIPSNVKPFTDLSEVKP